MSAPLSAQGTAGLGAKLDAAEKKLDDDIKNCRPIKSEDYLDLVIESSRNLKTLLKAAASGAPVDTETFKADDKRAKALFERARAAAAKPCPPPQQQPLNAPPPEKKAEPPKGETPMIGGQAVPIPRDPFYEFEDAADDAMDDLADAMEKCHAEAIKKLIAKLEEFSRRAHDMADAAKAAGKFSKIDPKEAQELAADIDWSIVIAKSFKCPVRPKKPAQPKSAPPQPEKPKPPEHSVIEDLFPKTPFIPPENRKGVSYELGPFASRILDTHNALRAEVGAPALQWNPELAANALDYARVLARTGQLAHAPRQGRGIERENLSQGMLGWNTDEMLRNWVKEKGDFFPGAYPNVARDGNWLNVSHYTQMIWPTTTDIGCGTATGSGFNWLVCRYSPGGNKDGKPVGLSTKPALQWIDTKTGKPVLSGPIVGVIEVSGSKAGPGGDTGVRIYNGALRPTGDYVKIAVAPDPSDPDRAYDPGSGRNFVRDPSTGQWTDAKTGKPVSSGPIVGVVEVSGSKPGPGGDSGVRIYSGAVRPSGDYAKVAAAPDPTDPDHAFDPESGRNFAKVPVEPKQAHVPERG